MKPFALDTVLSYRQRLEDIAKNSLAQASLAEQAVLNRLSEQQGIYRSLVATIEQLQQHGVNITDLIHHEDHLNLVRSRVTELETELKKKRDDVARVRRELLKKTRERQVMEKLKERQNSAWKHYLNKKEAAILDEIAIIYHNKQ